MIRSIFSIILLSISLSLGQITLHPGKPYTFDSTMYAYNARQVLKMDSIFRECESRALEISSLERQLKNDRALIDSLSSRASMLADLNGLYVKRMDYISMNDSLIRNDVKTYRDLYIETNKVFAESSKSRMSGTFWFVSGSVTGMLVIYLSSLVLHNIEN